MEWLLVPLLLGALPAVIAQRRGLDLLTWWLYGALLWPVAMIHVFFAKPGSVVISAGIASTRRKCPFCAETIQAEARVCRYCTRDLPQASASPVATSTIDACARCGRRLFPGSVNCGFCGTPIGAAKR